jgi:DNA primase
VINEHPDVNVRKLYAGEVAVRIGIPVADLARQAESRRVAPVADEPAVRVAPVPEFNAEFAAVALLIQRWDDIAPWLIDDLFSTETTHRAFMVLAAASESESGNVLESALAAADPEVAELLERAAVADIEVSPSSVAFDLIANAVRRRLAQRTRVADPDEIRADREARQKLEELDSERTAQAAAETLLWWLTERSQ